MNLSPHFTLEEATVSDTAARLGISNQPNAEQLKNMVFAAERLEKLREHIGSYIHVTSWLRVSALNLVIPGSSTTSAHQYGWAIDCHVGGMSAYDLCNRAVNFFTATGVQFDQIIHEYGSWMHVSFDTRYRGQLLTIFKSPDRKKKYIPGILTEEQYLNL